MARPIFEGSGVAVVTPFTSTGVDYAKLEKLVEFHIKNKSDLQVRLPQCLTRSTSPLSRLV
jgi:4-hydroxy-tetrahydrodipicolinate synthase